MGQIETIERNLHAVIGQMQTLSGEDDLFAGGP